MCDACPSFGDEIKVPSARPVQPGMMIEKDGMAEDGSVIERAERGEVRNRCKPSPTNDLVEFVRALRDVNLKRHVMVGGQRMRLLDGVGGAGVDLAGTDHAEKPLGRMLLRLLYGEDGLLKVAPTGVNIPHVFDSMPVARRPPCVTKHRTQIDPHTGPREHVVERAKS